MGWVTESLATWDDSPTQDPEEAPDHVGAAGREVPNSEEVPDHSSPPAGWRTLAHGGTPADWRMPGRLGAVARTPPRPVASVFPDVSFGASLRPRRLSYRRLPSRRPARRRGGGQPDDRADQGAPAAVVRPIQRPALHAGDRVASPSSSCPGLPAVSSPVPGAARLSRSVALHSKTSSTTALAAVGTAPGARVPREPVCLAARVPVGPGDSPCDNGRREHHYPSTPTNRSPRHRVRGRGRRGATGRARGRGT